MRGRLRVLAQPSEWVIYDAPTRCPYLPDQTARLPLRMPLRPLRAEEFAERLRAGDRRQGSLLYRTNCPTCHACEPIRIDVNDFLPNRTQRRVFRRCEAQIECLIGPPTTTPQKVTLYNRHKRERGLLLGDGLAHAQSYAQFLVETCADTIEITYRYKGALVGVAIADRAADALSAVYCFYDPDYGRFSLGTYSILKQIALCRLWKLRYLYLGLYVAECHAMSYKANFQPHERRIGGHWSRFGRREPAP